MDINTNQIKELRDLTGVSVMQCKKALEEAGGDLEKAKIILRKISKITADKKSERKLGSGTISSYIHNNGIVGSMVELLCETDFVAKNEDFKILARDIAMHIVALAPEYLNLTDIKEEEKIKAKELFQKETADKPKEMQEKIVEAKLISFFKEKTLMEQMFIKNQDIDISTLINQAIQKFGERIEIGNFTRFSIK